MWFYSRGFYLFGAIRVNETDSWNARHTKKARKTKRNKAEETERRNTVKRQGRDTKGNRARKKQNR